MKQTVGIDIQQKSKLTGFLTASDNLAKPLDTPHGKVQFLQAVGITAKELEMLRASFSIEKVEELIRQLEIGNPLLITDLDRK